MQDVELEHRLGLVFLILTVGIVTSLFYSWWQARRYHQTIGYSEGMDRLQFSELGLGVAWIVFIFSVLPPPVDPIPREHPIRIMLLVGGPLYKIIFQIIRGRGWVYSKDEVLRLRRFHPRSRPKQ